MPTYDYSCKKCNKTVEIFHSITNDGQQLCPQCKKPMQRGIGGGLCVLSKGLLPTVDDHKETEHKKKTGDLERAIRTRKKLFGSDSVGNPVDKPDPRHIIRKGKTIGGSEKTVDRQDFIKAAAKDPMMVDVCQKAIQKSSQKK